MLHLQIRGLARITLAPLVDTLPCMGAVQISLLEDPYIDFSISLFGSLDLMLLPGLKDVVNLVAKKVRAGAACERYKALPDRDLQAHCAAWGLDNRSSSRCRLRILDAPHAML